MQPDIMDLGSNLDETQAYLRITQEIISKIQVIYFSWNKNVYQNLFDILIKKILNIKYQSLTIG